MPTTHCVMSGIPCDISSRLELLAAREVETVRSALSYRRLSLRTEGSATSWTVGKHDDVASGWQGGLVFLSAMALWDRNREYRRLVADLLHDAVNLLASADSPSPSPLCSSVGLVGAQLLRWRWMSAAQRRVVLLILDRAVRDSNATASALDVAEGIAGLVPLLVRVARITGLQRYLSSAVKLGKRLIQFALAEPCGWSWPTADLSRRRNLVGLGHGASGVAVAFCHLYASTRDPAFKLAAEMALVYEDTFYDGECVTWTDPREPRALDALTSLLRGDVHPATAFLQRPAGVALPRRPLGWCFGTAGLVLARITAAKALNDRRYALHAREALSRALERTAEAKATSLLHGLAGVALACFAVAEHFSQSAFKDEGWRLLRRVRERRDAGDVADNTSVYRGDAGWGLACLAGYRITAIAPVHFHLADVTRHIEETPRASRRVTIMRRGHLAWHFGSSLSRVSALLARNRLIAPIERTSARIGTPADTARYLEDLCRHAMTIEVQRYLLDATAVEMCAYSFTRERLDYARALVAVAVSLYTLGLSAHHEVCIAEQAYLVEECYDWSRFLQKARLRLPPRRSHRTLVAVHCDGKHVHRTRLSSRDLRILKGLNLIRGQRAAVAGTPPLKPKRLSEYEGVDRAGVHDMVRRGILSIFPGEHR